MLEGRGATAPALEMALLFPARLILDERGHRIAAFAINRSFVHGAFSFFFSLSPVFCLLGGFVYGPRLRPARHSFRELRLKHAQSRSRFHISFKDDGVDGKGEAGPFTHAVS